MCDKNRASTVSLTGPGSRGKCSHHSSFRFSVYLKVFIINRFFNRILKNNSCSVKQVCFLASGPSWDMTSNRQFKLKSHLLLKKFGTLISMKAGLILMSIKNPTIIDHHVYKIYQHPWAQKTKLLSQRINRCAIMRNLTRMEMSEIKSENVAFIQIVIVFFRELKISFKNIILRFMILCKIKRTHMFQKLQVLLKSGDFYLVVLGYNTVSLIILLVSPSEKKKSKFNFVVNKNDIIKAITV